jgi:prepilin-type N-terminal cleavage/methylation domain-containing protein
MKTPLLRRRLGFTLVELLVVITIIAALAAVVMTMASRMKKSADESITTANLRQLGVAMVSFTAENNRFPSKQGDPVWDRCLLPFLGYSNTPTGTGNINSKAAADLDSVARIFASPADKQPRGKDTFKRSFAIVPWTTNWSNGTAFRGWKDLPFNKGIRYSMLNSPEKAAMVVQWYEGTSGTPNHLGSGDHAYHDIGGHLNTLGNFQQVLFADGHIEKLPARMGHADFVAKYWPGTVGNLN